jgi:hypothetical protein
MAVIPPPGKTGNRRPALRGVLMQDVSQGVERNRKWPEKRKAKLPDVTKDQNEQFRQYQWATKYFAPELYKMWAESVKGTPLLPRDIMTMLMSGRLMAINLPDGRIMYPKVAAMDVSASLDTITQAIGDFLIRGADGWEGFSGAIPGQSLTLINDQLLAADAASMSVSAIPQTGRDLIIAISSRGTTTTPGGRIRFNGDTGNNYVWEQWSRYGVGTGNPSSYIQGFEACRSDAAANNFSNDEMRIAEYASTAKHKQLKGVLATYAQTVNPKTVSQEVCGVWQSLAPITDFVVFPATGNFLAGTRLTTYVRG